MTGNRSGLLFLIFICSSLAAQGGFQTHWSDPFPDSTWSETESLSSLPSHYIPEDDALTGTFGVTPFYLGSNSPAWFVLSGTAYAEYGPSRLVVQSLITNEQYGMPFLGSSYSRGGIIGRNVTAYYEFKGQYVDLVLGRRPLRWGVSGDRSVISSRSAVTFDHVEVVIKTPRFTFDILTGQLRSGSDSIGKRIRRLTAGHLLSYNSPTGNLLLTVGQQIIYTGENRSLELIYLNPVVPFFLTALENEEEREETGNNDNSILFFGGFWELNSQLKIFCEFLIDDYQIDKTPYENAIGIVGGIKGSSELIKRKLYYQIEYSQVSPWTYIHYGQESSWQNAGLPLGTPFGSDFRSIRVVTAFDVYPKTQVFTDVSYLEKGTNRLDTPWANGKPRDKHVDVFMVYNYGVRYNSRFGNIQAGIRNYLFLTDIAVYGRPQNNPGFYVSLSGSADFPFMINY